mmetsp:Transcript_27702/g.85639  ORF Transcript_27702/g.85639 Transcript_27702/m.85639 type:complete len:560 (+) Transcript_27702:1523-3202(+)
MSNVYHTEPPTNGKVIFHTSVGPVDVELWSKEAPLACRNFVQLALEGYYDKTVFHRVIPGFMAQGGDPTGTGEGGDSVWGKPFKDEIQARIRFNHRGQLAMANENSPSTNRAQFFFTLDACPWLDGKHTIFGTVAGNTVFNMLRMGEVETDDTDRPTEPITLRTVEVLANPFDDIVPRDLKGDKEREEEARRLAEKAAKPQGKKDLTLLSFGDEEAEAAAAPPAKQAMRPAAAPVRESKPVPVGGVAEDSSDSSDSEEEPSTGLKAKVAAAAAQAGPRDGAGFAKKGGAGAAGFAARMAERIKARAQAVATREKTDQARAAKRRKTAGDEDDELGFEGELGDTHDDAAAKALEAKRQEAREERKKLRKKAGEDAKKLRPAVAASRPAPARLAADEQRADADAAARDLVSPFEALRRKNRDRNKKTKGRESDTLAKLAAFSSGMKTKKVEIGDVERSAPATYAGQVDSDSDSDDDGADWFAGKLKFKKHTDDLFRTGGGRALGGDGRSADDYAVIDTRDGGGLGGQPRKPERPAMYTGAYGERLEARDSKGAGRGRGDRR